MKLCLIFLMIFGTFADLIGWNRVWNNVDSHYSGRTSLLRDPFYLDLKAQVEKFLDSKNASPKNKQRLRTLLLKRFNQKDSNRLKKTQSRKSARNIRLRFYKETLGKIQQISYFLSKEGQNKTTFDDCYQKNEKILNKLRLQEKFNLLQLIDFLRHIETFIDKRFLFAEKSIILLRLL